MPFSGMGSDNGYTQDDGMEGLAATRMDANMMQYGPVQTLDQMISHNNQELMRRRQTFGPRFQADSPQAHSQHDPERRASMLEFSSTTNGDLADFQFDPNPQHAAMSSRVASNTTNTPQRPLDPRKVRSKEDLSLDTRFSQMSSYDGGSMSAYPASMIPNTGARMDMPNSFLPQSMETSNNYDDTTADLMSMNMTQNPTHQSIYTTSPATTSYPMNFPNNHDPGGGGSPANSTMIRLSQAANSNASSPQRYLANPQNQMRRQPMMPSPLSRSAQNPLVQTNVHNNSQSSAHVPPGSTAAQHQPSHTQSRRSSMEMGSPYINQPGHDAQMDSRHPPTQAYKSRWANAYSTTGFDMLAILMRVATRKDPQINIGPVDLSCAFVVCDIAKHDLPIVYCSDMFERLTGYSRHDILGRNCRFLQAPDGKVQSGIKRKYVDDKSVLYLKNQVVKREEAQLSLINYKKGGQPFMNLLTMIPIAWDTEELKYFVGFQVDLVEQPNSVSAKNPDGTYEINYNRSALPAYRLPAPDTSSALENMGGQTISKDEISQVLATIGSGDNETSRRIWDKVLLENTDDVVHVLSLKGLFLYLSPACKTVLEYEPSELVGTALSSVCHPSDIVPVTRELKDSSNGSAVNVVYRIRRKNSGYTWFEAHGSLHTEQGKGRKCIILVGRQRPVYALERSDIDPGDNAGDAELWTKLSTTGMFLYVSSTSRTMLDRIPDDLLGTSMQALMRPDSRKEFGRVLELARMGEKSTFKHDLQNRRGQVLQAQTTIYPGDAKKGLKPTFLLGQTRLLKMTRAMLLNHKSAGPIPRSDASMGPDTPVTPLTPAVPSQVPNHRQIGTNPPTGNEAFVSSSGILTEAGSGGVPIGSQDEALASETNIFDELKTTRSTSWQFELRQMERQNRLLAEDLQTLMSRKKKRKRRKGLGNLDKDCANCHTRVTPEWRRGPSGQRDLCNSCGLRWAKQYISDNK
ncbi:hypothetical protein LTR64_001299 [Lithohypha guttulata]|uniref:uncharacterized protein n=1 Tax=Lithohypha guttulata TaxID=1690604 RepID=UPI002DE19871|nr:hypothetical protein LTR51_003493 [Lithohypha guttulata]